ncbi:transcriptional regulator, SARP family [Kribbella flavida DSM 17836]|uniref:Transcriptional regulator, SARP family n=1 Tax=Kribbella flavida (strain DSM 17836 / JCM 10339 / NBRC 14399) TaxID=479435 RepID=D2PYW6_KRIFD|nr:transcriptional regulator, SARP family [Kribbella flavida DSM 17836]
MFIAAQGVGALLPSAYHATTLRSVEFRLLGPVQIWSAGQQVELKRRQERLLLAVLLLEPGKAVPAERLIELLWPEELPGSPKRALQVYMSRLRNVLAAGDSRLLSGPHGYAVETPRGRTDVELFAALVEQAKPLDDLEQRRKLLIDALALWRGPALADVASEDVRRRLCAGLDESRWAAQELRLTTELALGRHQDLLPELAELTEAQPTRESLTAARMLALYRSGRQTDALAVYADLVRHLSDELGVQPGSEVRDLQVAILRQDESLDYTAPTRGPRELPADIAVLVGRDALLHELAAVLRPQRRPSGLPAVVCLYGAAGTGKSAAAIRLGHELAGEYPDGQLFARLQDVDGEPVPPAVLLGRLLRSLGVDSVPDAVEERAALLRSTLAGKSVLTVFDDAADVGQLRPLLPADGRCAVVVTSRRPLLGLEDATHRELLPLGSATSAQLLAELSGRPAGELQPLVEYCVGLPLALRIVGARLSLIREDIADVVRTLADETRRLDYLVAGDRAVRASLDLTLRTASPTARRLFGCLALVTADEFSAWVAAPLLDLDESLAGTVLDELLSLGLVQLRRTAPATYGLHALVRARAVEELAGFSADDREMIELRYLQAVLRLLTIAEDQVGQNAYRGLEYDQGEGRPLPEADAAAAAGPAWLDVEAPVVLAAVRLAAGRPRLAAMLAMRLDDYLLVRDQREMRETALALAESATAGGDPMLEAEVLRRLFAAKAQGAAGMDELTALAGRARDVAARSGHPDMQALALGQVAYVTSSDTNYEAVVEVAEQILALADRCTDPAAVKLRALDWLSAGLAGLGRLPEAIAAKRRIRQLSTPGTRVHAIRLVLLALTLTRGEHQGAEHLDELAEIAVEARQIVDRIGDELGQAHVGLVEARLSMVRGDLAGANERLDAVAAMFAERPDAWGDVNLRITRAWVAIRGGRRNEGLRMLADGMEAVSPVDYPAAASVLREQLEVARRETSHSA